MAKYNSEYNVVAGCPGCWGAQSSFIKYGGEIHLKTARKSQFWFYTFFLFYRCGSCNHGGMGKFILGDGGDEKLEIHRIKSFEFYPDVLPSVRLPEETPEGIENEFREAEKCLQVGCLRAAAGLFRSVLDKTLRANGFHTKKEGSLYKQIEAAAKEGILTASRRRRAHEDIRVLGNDVLHDEWHPIPEDDVLAAQHYAQRIIEDFYDDRESVTQQLREAGRLPEKPEEEGT